MVLLLRTDYQISYSKDFVTSPMLLGYFSKAWNKVGLLTLAKSLNLVGGDISHMLGGWRLMLGVFISHCSTLYFGDRVSRALCLSL